MGSGQDPHYTHAHHAPAGISTLTQTGALEGSRPREQEEERASPRSPAQGDLPGPQASADMCWGTTAGLAAQRPLHWAPGRPPATPRQQLLLPGVPLDS